eukprot:SAG31_NODE_69_length_28130_cov_15.318219_10_plen_145_part_00
MRMITNHVEQAVIAAHLVPVVFVGFHGTVAQNGVLFGIVILSLCIYATYIDRSRNSGRMIYNRLLKLVGCFATVCLCYTEIEHQTASSSFTAGTDTQSMITADIVASKLTCLVSHILVRMVQLLVIAARSERRCSKTSGKVRRI